MGGMFSGVYRRACARRDRIGGHMKVVTWLVLSSALIAGAVRAEERPPAHGTGPGPAPFDSQRPPDDSAGPSVDTLRKTLKESAPGSAAYWTAAHALLKALGNDTKRLDDIENELPARRKSLFQELRKARGNADNSALLKTATTGSGDAKEAAKAELDRRIADPNVQFVLKELGGRPEKALERTTSLLAALASGDEKKAAEIIARMFGTIDTTRRDTLAKHTKEILDAPDKLREKGLDQKLVQKLFDAARFTQDKGSVPKSTFTDALEKAMALVDQKNQRFHENVARVIRGGPDAKEARDALLREYAPEDLADFINLQIADGNDGRAVDVARALAREDKDGNLVLDLEGSSFAFGDKDRNQALFLGKKSEPEQIRAALTAFLTGEQRGHDGELDPNFNSAKTDRLQRFRIAATPSDSAVRLFAGEDDGGKPALRRSTTPVPTEKLAKQKIAKANQLPNPPVITPTPTPTTTPTGGTPPPPPPGDAFALVKRTIETGSCKECHKSGGEGRPLNVSGSSLADGKINGFPIKEVLERGARKTGVMRPPIIAEIRELLKKL